MNLRLMEKEDLPLFLKWINDPAFSGEYNPLEQETRVEMEKSYDTAHPDRKRFFVEKKDGTKIGVIGVFPEGDLWEVGFALVSGERRKGKGIWHGSSHDDDRLLVSVKKPSSNPSQGRP